MATYMYYPNMFFLFICFLSLLLLFIINTNHHICFLFCQRFPKFSDDVFV